MDLLKTLSEIVANVELVKVQLDQAKQEAELLVSQQPQNDKLYSQAELEAKIQEAIAPLQTQVSQLQIEIESIPAKIELAKIDAVAQFKSEFLEKYKAAQEQELQIENSIQELLK